MKEDDFEASIWAIWKEVHDKIGPIRDEAYKTLAFVHMEKKRYSSLIGSSTNKIEHDDECYKQKTSDLSDLTKLAAFAEKAVECARKFQAETENLTTATPKEVLAITTKAGVLLASTEEILFAFDTLKDTAKGQSHHDILSMAMTVAATARDQILAADGFVKNIKERIGTKERTRLLYFLLVPVVAIYLIFHPFLHLPWSVQDTYRVFWEMIFWSLFGAISISVITVAEDVMGDTFDPRHLEKYEYRIAVSPFVSIVLILFLSFVGLVTTTSGSSAPVSTLRVDIVNPNFSVLVVFSFLFGFFGKRTLDILDIAWRRLFPSSRSNDGSGAASSTSSPTPSP